MMRPTSVDHRATRYLRVFYIVFAWALAPWNAQSLGQDVSQYDVVWDSPSADANGSMPLGNGDISLNAWIEPDGDLRFYIGKSDSWGEHGRLLKVGKVRVSLDPPLATEPFEQRLSLRDGAMIVRCGQGLDAVELRLWVDANHPVVRVEVDSALERVATVSIERWRTERSAIPRAQVSDTFEDRSKPNNLRRAVFVGPDVLIPGLRDSIGWYHHAREASEYSDLVRIQGLSAYYNGKPDPLLDRVFGALIKADSGRRQDESHLRSPRGHTHRFEVHVLTEHPSSPKAWLEAANDLVRKTDSVSALERWAAHRRWWASFWDRSWIEVTTARALPPRIVPENSHPVRIGVDQAGQNRFIGDIARMTILPAAVGPTQVLTWARTRREDPAPSSQEPLYATRGPVGALIEGSSRWTFDQGLSLEAWIKPGALPPGGGRIVDKVTVGSGDGWLFDTYPGSSLRLIVGNTIVLARDVLPEGTWSHVAAVVDPGQGRLSIYLDGNEVASAKVDVTDDAAAVSRGYALQRYVDACAGRGHYPIKYNGSLFTVPHEGQWGDADYRRWGPGYWWQNTRLPYLSMCTSGDFEMMQPLFRMYVEQLSPVHALRSRQYTGHEGLLIPECMYFWGGTFASTYGWTPMDQRGDDRLQESGWHKREWVNGPELVWMMLDYYDYTQDAEFLRESLLPFATGVLRFFDEQFPTDDTGTLVMEPSQSLETWWDTTNPMPEVAGLRAVTARLLALPDDLTEPAERAFWAALARKLPDLPTRRLDGVEMLAPASRFEQKNNVENPELYAVFPFRLVSFEKPSAPLGIAALKARRDRGPFGWRQDDLFMTHLGLAEQAREYLVSRARNKHKGSRFPAFWGPNYDWIPDQDHGGVLMRTLQTMLVQSEGRTIYLLPAWPKDWDASFKLHAPYQTVLTGRVEGGRVVDLTVEPASRRSDLIIRDLDPTPPES